MQKRQTSITNKLFLICPSSQLESFISKHYGSNIYYLTALGAVFDFRQIAYAEAVADFIRRIPIREIYLTQDTTNIFMQNMLTKQPGFGTAAEKTLLNLLIDNYSYIMRHSSRQDQLNCLAGLVLEQQAAELMANTLLQQTIFETGTCLKGLLIKKTSSQIKELVLNPTAFCK